MYEAGIKYILGLNIEGNMLKIKPNIPANWKEYSIRYKYGNSIYNIKVKNENSEAEKGVFLDGKRLEKPEIILNGNGGVYSVEVRK